MAARRRPPSWSARSGAQFKGAQAGNGWGMTETSATFTHHMGEDYANRPDSAGPPVPVCDLKVTDPDGARAARGQSRRAVGTRAEHREGLLAQAAGVGGNLHRRLGAHRRPRADRRRGLRLHHRPRQGHADPRRREHLLRRGRERALRSPGGDGRRDRRAPAPQPRRGTGGGGDAGPGSTATEAELRAFVAARLAAFKVPVEVRFWDGPLPRNANGKILKTELKKLFATALPPRRPAEPPRHAFVSPPVGKSGTARRWVRVAFSGRSACRCRSSSCCICSTSCDTPPARFDAGTVNRCRIGRVGDASFRRMAGAQMRLHSCEFRRRRRPVSQGRRDETRSVVAA